MFLATTALEKFWDPRSKILFLGDWCLLHGRREAWEKLDYEVLPYPLRLEEGAAACGKVYESALTALTERLNRIHGLSFSPRYWRIVLGPWLMHYTQLLYDRHLCLRSALDSHPGLETIGLSPDSYFTPADFIGLQTRFHTDAYNLQLFTQLGELMGLAMPRRRAFPIGTPEPEPRLLKRLAFALDPVPRMGKDKVWFVNSMIPPGDRLRLALATGLRALPAQFLARFPPPGTAPAAPHPARAGLADLSFSKDDGEFPRLLVKTLPVNFPWTFLERFAVLRKRMEPFVSRAPKALAAMTSLYDSAYLFLSAELQETRGTRLICVQHGGSFGMAKHSPVERHEVQVADEYWSWGWNDRPVHSFLRRPGKPVGDGPILYCGNSVLRYAYRLWSNPIGPQWARVIEWNHRWIRSLGPEASAKLIVRPYPIETYLWQEKERLRELFPSLRFDPPGLSFEDSLGRCSLFVTDTNTTTLLQAFALDKPTVLFWDSTLNELRDSAAPYFDRLREAGILYNSPEAAARKVNEVCRDPLAWWRRAEVRKAAGEFRSRFAYVSSQPIEDWAGELRRLAQA